MEVPSRANGAWLGSWVSSHHGQVPVVADLVLCFIGCKVNELLFLSNINLRGEHYNFVLRSLYTGIKGVRVSWGLPGDLSFELTGEASWPEGQAGTWVCSCGLLQRVWPDQAFETSCLSPLGHKACFVSGKECGGQDFLSLCGGGVGC